MPELLTELINTPVYNPLNIGKSSSVSKEISSTSNLLEQQISDLGKKEEKFLSRQGDLTDELGKALLNEAEGKNLLRVKEKELEAERERKKKEYRDQLGEQFYNSPDMQEFKKFADESADKMMFVPSQTTAPLLGIVFATIGATGMLLGGNSKANARAALSAMNGMAEGFAKGKEDLYKQERQTFDTNVKAMTQRMAILKSKLDVAREKMKYDAESADIEANAAFAEAGATFLKENKDKFGLENTIIKLETQIKQNDTWARLMATQKASAVARLESERFKDQQSKLDRDQKNLLTQFLEQGRIDRAASDRALRLAISQASQNKPTIFQGKDGSLYSVTPDGKVNKLEGTEGLTKPSSSSSGGKGSATQQQFENIVAADVGNAWYRVNLWLENSKNLKDIPVGSKFLRDKGTQEGIIEAYKNYAINRTLPGDLQRNDAALLGIAFDIVAARSFGRSAGVTDAKIAQVIRQFPIEGDDDKTRETKLKILFNQLDEVNKRLPPEKQTDPKQYLTSPVANGLYSEYEGKSNKELGSTQTGDGPKEGDKAQSKSGKPIVFKNGQWEYSQ